MLRMLSNLLRVEQNGDVVGSEWGFAGRRAGTYHGLMVFAGAEAGFELGGDLIEASGGVAHDEPRLTGAGVACAHGAGLTGILCGFCDMHSGLCEDSGYSAL